MLPDFDQRLRALAEVVVRIGVNLQPGQPLLVTDPYELHGVHPEAKALAEAIRSAAFEAGCPHPAFEIIVADPSHLRALAEANDTRAFDRLVAAHVSRLDKLRARGGAFLFLTGSEPRLFHGLQAARVTQFDQIKWRHLGPLIQKLIRGATQWTLVPSPTSAWADVAFADLPADQRLAALWRVVFESFRVGRALAAGPGLPSSDSPTDHAIAAWRTHLAGLALLRDRYNAARHRRIRYVGTGTDLTLALPRSHAWCTAQLVSQRGAPFVVNLPTEELFTAPHRHSADGRVRVARPVIHAGTLIQGITLEFVGGRVVAAVAEEGQDLLRQLLATDAGASQLGEVAIVPNPNVLSLAGRCFHHAILDENAVSHIALGEAYRFCSHAWLPWSINSSQIHVDLPLDARVELS